MKRMQRNLVIGVFASFGVLGASGANALSWSETPQVVGTIIGGGIGAAIGSASTNPFIVGAASTAGGIAGAKAGPYVADNPKKSFEIYSFIASGPVGMISSGYKAGTSVALNFIKSLF